MIKVFIDIYFMFDLKTKHGYVGRSIHLETRMKEHWFERNCKVTYTNKWLCTLSSPPPYRVLKKCIEKNWEKWEIYWIAKMREEGWTLTNLTESGDGNNGFRPTEETRKKMSISKMGNTIGLGYRHTKETKRKYSINRMGKTSPMKGKKSSRETRKKQSIAKMGNKYHLNHTHTEEARKNMREAHARRKREVGKNLLETKEYILPN